MEILLTADLHYQEDNKGDVAHFIKEINSTNAEVLIIAGDVSGGVELSTECLQQFRDFPKGKYLVAGNHDLWTEDGDSFEIYSSTFPKLAAQCGFHSLDKEPAILGNVGLVGTVGWYDYSLREESLITGVEAAHRNNLHTS